MKKLTKHTNFKALKSDIKSGKANPIKDKKLMSEFKAFLNLLQSEFSIRKKAKTVYGKNTN